jgi:DNA segregation ATPase FtsK/SpoIIIE, S-DNA-T family
MVRVSPVAREGFTFAVTPDFLSLGEAEVLARALAHWEPSDDAAQLLADRAANARAGQEFLDLFGIGDARLWDPRQLWGQVTGADRLRVPLGKTPTGKVVWLDLKEAAEGGMGPHGMMTGQTGSGKSEHLKALVLALAMLHPPDQLQFLLGDFKGEAAFAGLEYLPHVQGVVSNLKKSAHKLDRLEAVIRGEVMRREELLNATGYKDVRDYESARATTKPGLEPLGALLIVADEFSELLAIRPELAKVFEHVGLVGRALWIHILNASQRVETGKMAGLLPQQTYSIGLKVKDAAQSRAAIGSARAYEDLKRAPQGSAFLVVDDEHTRYRSFFISAPFVEPKLSTERLNVDGHFVDVHRFTAAVTPLPADVSMDPSESALREDEGPIEEPGVDAPTVLSVLADRITRAGGRRGHRLWLPPLEDIPAIPIDELAGEFWGRDWLDVTEDGGLIVPFAREDDPFRHAQDVVSLDLSGAAGHTLVVGGGQTGKSTTLRTLIMMLAISHSPQRVQFYCIDLGGGQMNTVAGLPHISAIAGAGNDEKMRRIISEVERIRRFRLRYWEQAGLDLQTFRQRKSGLAQSVGQPGGGDLPDDGHGDVFLVIDNVRALQNDFADLHDRVTSLVADAANYGIHLMLSNDQWISVRPAILAKVGSRVEMRMADPVESTMGDREAARRIPEQAGRALQRGGMHMLVAVPQADGAEYAGGVPPTAAAVAGAWRGRGVAPAPPLQMLPAEIAYHDLPPAQPETLKLGMGESEMSTVAVDLNVSPHFLAVGSNKCGRSSVLKTLCAAIADTFTPEQAEVVLFDPNYQLADAVDPAYLKVYAHTISEVSAASAAIAQRLNDRQPPAGTPPKELAKWRHSGPRWFVIVDDLNVLTPPGTNQSALFPLVTAIESGKQLGLYILASHQINGWFATGSLNRVVRAMSNVGAGVLVMDGDRADKIVEDVRAAPRVPGRGELVYRKSRELVQVALPPQEQQT